MKFLNWLCRLGRKPVTITNEFVVDGETAPRIRAQISARPVPASARIPRFHGAPPLRPSYPSSRTTEAAPRPSSGDDLANAVILHSLLSSSSVSASAPEPESCRAPAFSSGGGGDYGGGGASGSWDSGSSSSSSSYSGSSFSSSD